MPETKRFVLGSAISRAGGSGKFDSVANVEGDVVENNRRKPRGAAAIAAVALVAMMDIFSRVFSLNPFLVRER